MARISWCLRCRSEGKDTWVRGSYLGRGLKRLLNSPPQSQHPSLRPVGLPARERRDWMKLKPYSLNKGRGFSVKALIGG